MLQSSINLLIQSPDLIMVDNKIKIYILKLKYSLLEHMESVFHKFFIQKDLSKFDPHVGENSCQVRTCQLLCLLDEFTSNHFSESAVNQRIAVIRQTKEVINNKLLSLKDTIVIYRYQPPYKRKKHVKQSLEEFLKVNNCFCELNDYEIFLLHIYILSKYKKINHKQDIVIDFLKIQSTFALSKTAARRLIHKYQVRVSEWTCQFVKNIAESSDKLNHLVSILNKLERRDEDGRKMLPLFLTTEILLNYLLNANKFIVVLVERRHRGVHLDYLMMYFKPNVEYSDFIYCGNESDIEVNSTACFYIYGVMDYQNSETVESTINYIVRFNKVGLINIIMADIAIHPQYSGTTAALYKNNPYSILLNDDFVSKKSRSILHRFNERSAFAVKYGYGKGSTYLLFIKHIVCEYPKNNLHLLNQVNAYRSNAMELSSYIKNIDLFSIIPCNVYWVDINNIYQGCNNQQAIFFGLNLPSNIIGKRNIDLTTFANNIDAAKLIDSNNCNVFESGMIETFEEIYFDLDDNEIHYISKKMPIRNEKNIVIGLIAIITEVTKKDSDKILHRKIPAIDDLQSIIQHVPGYVTLKDMNGRYIACNEGQTHFLGFQSGSEVIGKTDFDLPTQKLSAEESNRNDTAIMNRGSATTFEESIKIGSKKITVLTQKIPLRDKKQLPLGIMTISVDITETRKFEEQIWLLEHIIGSVPGHVWWKDINCRFLGCNDQQAIDAGFNSRYMISGKSAYDIITKNQSEEERIRQAQLIDDVDKKMLAIGEGFTIEESVVLPNGVREIWLSTKDPLYDRSGNIIGLIGVSVNITDKRDKEWLKVEIEAAKAVAEEQEKFRKIVGQMLHDIQSPLTALHLIISDTNTEMSESNRVTLRRATERVESITRGLLNKYRNKEEQNLDGDPLLVYLALQQVISEKREEYKQQKVSFIFDIAQDTKFIFIKANTNEFKRMISNIINNGIEAALKDKDTATIILRMSLKKNAVMLSIADDGYGMPKHIQEKFNNGESVSEGKSDGHGIGLVQIRDTILANGGKCNIFVIEGKETEIVIQFPTITNPSHIATSIQLFEDDTILILDDDESIHGAWDNKFAPIQAQFSSIKMEHFHQGSKALTYINSLTQKQKEKMLLLADYELLNQEINGIEVIKKANLKRAILVTSYSMNTEIYNNTIQEKIKLLPKELAPEVKIEL